MIAGRELFRFCACCPSPCRHAIPPGDALQLESTTPSALSLVALAVIDGQLAFDADTRRVLANTAHARACRPACVYGHDIASSIERFVAERT
jgi:hypothetical protein